MPSRFLSCIRAVFPFNPWLFGTRYCVSNVSLNWDGLLKRSSMLSKMSIRSGGRYLYNTSGSDDSGTCTDWNALIAVPTLLVVFQKYISNPHFDQNDRFPALDLVTRRRIRSPFGTALSELEWNRCCSRFSAHRFHVFVRATLRPIA